MAGQLGMKGEEGWCRQKGWGCRGTTRRGTGNCKYTCMPDSRVCLTPARHSVGQGRDVLIDHTAEYTLEYVSWILVLKGSKQSTNKIS